MSERYELKGKIGEGGIGTVHKAFDTQLKRDVAIKRLIPVEGGNTVEAAENLIKEATTLSALQHPNIVTVYDVGTDEQGGFVVMELLKGETFDETINRGALTEGDFRNVVEQTLEAMIAAHHSGLIHRDLKPSNLMVNWMPSGKFQIKILDFGLAKFSKQPSVQTIDQGDAILGSIYFMAPEQFERIPLDARTDLYSMGAMYYQCLTGKYPFDGETAPMVMASHLQNRVQPLATLRPDLPAWMCNWVMWLISRKMEDRPETAKFAYEQFNVGKASPAQEAQDAAVAAAAAVVAQQQAAPVFIPPTPAVPPIGYGTTQPLGGTQPMGRMAIAPKPTFPKWAMITIPLLIAIAVIIAVMKFGGRSERKAREALMVKLHEQIENEETPEGNRQTVETVVDYMLEHSDNTDTANSAIRILGELQGDGVDAAIADSLPKIKSSRQLQGMLVTIAQRGYEAGVPAIMKYAAYKDQDVKRMALSAVAELGGREQLPELLEMVVDSIESGNGDGKPYGEYIIQIASKIPNENLRTAEIRKAAESLNGKGRGALLEMLGPLGGEAALKEIELAMNGADKDAKIGALRGLARWPDSAPSELLFKAASDKSDAGLQLVAISSYSRNVARPSPHSAAKKLAQLEKIYPQIERPKSKRLLFNALGTIIDPGAKELAERLAEEDPAIAKYARMAAAQVEASLKKLAVVKETATLQAKDAIRDAYLLEYSEDPKMKAYTNWTHPQDHLHWPVRFEEAGTYKVTITQSCEEDDKDRYEVTVAGATLDGQVVSTGAATKFKDVELGNIEVPEAGGYTLSVSPKGINGELLMHIRSVRIDKP